MIGKIMSFMAAAAMVSVTPAVAQASDTKKQSTKDPNEVVCERQEVLGSRVATKRICMTRSEWAEKRRLERLEIDKAQVNRGSCEGCQ